MPMDVFLASASPRRQELMRWVVREFQVEVSQVDETLREGLSPMEIPCTLARRKALAVAENHPDALVIGADTVVLRHGRLLEKPRDERDAIEILGILSGGWHEVATGMCLVLPRGQAESFTQMTRVKFYDLSEREIAAYVHTGEPMDKAGAYGIQAGGGRFVEEIQGDYSNVVGFPVARVCRELSRLLGESWAEISLF